MNDFNDIQIPDGGVAKRLSDHMESSGIAGYEFWQFWNASGAATNQKYVLVREFGQSEGDRMVTPDRVEITFISLPNDNPTAMRADAERMVRWLKKNWRFDSGLGVTRFTNVSPIMTMPDNRYAVKFEVSVLV